jgi:putative phosphonate metabolism protein
MRYALYFTPDPASELADLGERWLGRSAVTGKVLDHPELPGLSVSDLAAITGPARRYGFHGTLKAPFRLIGDAGESDLLSAMKRFASDTRVFEIPALKLSLLEGFLALTPDGPTDQLNAFANSVVERFESLRAELSEKEIERRNPDLLSSVELKNLLHWGYPYVFDRFRFHMTLSTRLAESDVPKVLGAAADYFAPVLGRPVPVDALSLSVEPEPGAPFRIHTRMPLASQTLRKTA